MAFGDDKSGQHTPGRGTGKFTTAYMKRYGKLAEGSGSVMMPMMKKAAKMNKKRPASGEMSSY